MKLPKIKKKILFRSDGNREIGYGHFIRTLALAEMLSKNFECILFSVKPDNFQTKETGNICKLISLPENNSNEAFINYINGDEIVFLDNYYFDTKFEKQIKEKGCSLVTLATPKYHHYADVVINYVEEDKNKFSLESYSQLVAGLEWVILRSPFRTPLYQIKPRSRYVISLGGSDQFRITEKIIENIDNKENVDIICTDAFGEERIQNLKGTGVKLYRNINSFQIANLFENSIFSILSSSTVCLEAISRGAKVFAGYYIDNQIGIYNKLLEKQLITGLGNLMIPENIDNIIEIVNNFNFSTYNPEWNINFSDQEEKYNNLFMNLCR